MMRKIILLVACAILLVASSVSGQSMCDPVTDRHCFEFQEQDVESTFDGVGEVVTPAPVVDEEEEEEAPVIDVPADEGPTDETITSVPSNSRSTDGGDNGIHTRAVVAMALGGTLLLVGAVVVRRRQQTSSNDSENDLSIMNSTSGQPSGDNAV